MKDLIKAQTDELRKKFIWNEGEGGAPPTGGGEEKPAEPQKLKIDIPDTPFEPDINQVKDRLKQILKQWKIAGKSDAGDIIKLITYLDGEK